MKRLFVAAVIMAFFVLAIWQLGRAGLLAGKAWAAPLLIERAWQLRIETGVAVRPWPWADGVPVARIDVPRLGVERYVIGGDTMRNLAFGPVSLKKKGGTVLFGHTDTHFRFLEKLKIEDVVLFEKKSGKLEKWQVQKTKILLADNLYLENTSKQQLMFVTCYPFDSLAAAPEQRFVIWLKRV